MKFKVFTWNIGRTNPDKLQCIQTEMFSKTEPDTIYVVGLQEINYYDVDKINKSFKEKIPKSYGMTHGRKSSFKDFDLVTLIFFPIGIEHKMKYTFSMANATFHTKKIPSKKGRTTMIDTKGYLWCDFEIDGVQYTIVNIHLPFQNEEFSLANFKLLQKTFENKQNVIIFGDYNTRSKVDDSCLGNTICDVKFEKNAENSVSVLENTLNKCKVNSGNANCENIQQKLTQYDYLNQVKDIMRDYYEDEITFLPSYKINKTGDYSLVKDGKRRLAGYADRILVKGEDLRIIPNSYKRIDCLGNDHFPIVVEVEHTSPKEKSITLSSGVSIAKSPKTSITKTKKKCPSGYHADKKNKTRCIRNKDSIKK